MQEGFMRTSIPEARYPTCKQEDLVGDIRNRHRHRPLYYISEIPPREYHDMMEDSNTINVTK
jgi:hypothetical protein